MSQIIYTIEDCLSLYNIFTGKGTILDIMYSFVDKALDQYLFENISENILRIYFFFEANHLRYLFSLSGEQEQHQPLV